MIEWLKHSQSMWPMLIAPLLATLMNNSGHRPSDKRDGWNVLKPAIAMQILGALCLFIAIFTIIIFFLVIAAMFQGLRGSAFLFLIFSPLVVAGASYVANGVFLIRTRFNCDGIEQRDWKQKRFEKWEDVKVMERDAFHGPRLLLKDGSWICVAESLKGFNELKQFVIKRGIDITL